MKRILLPLLLLFPLLTAAAPFVPPGGVSQQQETLLLNHLKKVLLEPPPPAPLYDPAVPLQKPGLENFYQVSPSLYRGAQPTAQGYKSLAEMGIKTVVSLRAASPDRALIESLGLNSKHIPINPFFFRDRHAKQFIDIMSNPFNYPVYVHCQYGSDRTGTSVALYRIVFQNWPREKALEEMKQPQFGFHNIFGNLVNYLLYFRMDHIYNPKRHELRAARAI